MENKLKMELDALPAPATAFEDLKALPSNPTTFRRRKRTAVILAAVLVLVLGGCVGAKESLRYGMWFIYGSHGWPDVQHATGKFGIILPEELDGVPFDEYQTNALVPQGVSRLEAYLNPVYRPYCVDYAVWETTEITLPDGTPSTYHHTPENLNVHFGTTENPLYRYYFQLDENGIWTGCEVPESFETVEYQGITIQVGDTFFYDSYFARDRYIRWACWVDEEKQVAFSISEADYTDPNRVVECAKAIIDLNSQE